MFTSQITFFPCIDQQETDRFYTEVLGFSMVLDQGRCRIYRSACDAFLGFCSGKEFQPSDTTIITLVTEDVDGWARRIKKLGWAIEVEPRINVEFRIYQCFLRDPNGHLVEIQRFLDPFP